MTKWTYTILNIVFFAPIILLIYKRYWATVKKEKKFIILSAILGFIIFFIIDPIATHWGAWGFDYRKTLGIYFGLSVIEELIWAMLVSMITATAIAVAANKEEQGKKFHLSHLFRSK
jgi:lycopene cyclase domain-containing protein